MSAFNWNGGEPLQQAVAEYHTIVGMGGGFTEDLNVISSQAEELGIEVESIRHEGSSITVISQADNSTAFDDYSTALEESGRFSSVTPPVERPQHPPVYDTRGTITLKPKPSEPAGAE